MTHLEPLSEKQKTYSEIKFFYIVLYTLGTSRNFRSEHKNKLHPVKHQNDSV